MTSQYRHRRSSAPTQTFIALEPGEIGVNTANRQLSVGDAAPGSLGVPLALLAVRVFDARAAYAANDYVVNAGILYRARYATGPSVFDQAAWDTIAGQQTGSYVLRTGDTMTGQLALPPGPAADQAVRKDYVDTAIAPLATKVDVDAADAQALLKSGGTMTGQLSLAAAPTLPAHAANKSYVDAQVPSLSSYVQLSGGQTITGGYRLTSFFLGNSTGLTVTPNPYNGNYQHIVNNGAFTIAAPANDCAIDILVSNVTGAGNVTMSGFTTSPTGHGDTWSNKVGDRFVVSIRRMATIAMYSVKQYA